MLDRWLALIARVVETPGHDAAKAVFEDLYTRYTAADRRYHDIHHINGTRKGVRNQFAQN